MRRKGFFSKLSTIIFIIIVIIVLKQVYGIYKTYYYNDFIKAEYTRGLTTFSRDNKVKYNEDNSYKMNSVDYNDAIFYKNIKVQKNTPYRITCKVKTQNVENQKEVSNGGAQISILNTTETSKPVSGTTEWQEIELLFNSKNRESIDIGFRLGGNDDNSKGTAWFTDMKLEEGIVNSDTNWHVGCFVLKNVDINLFNEHIELQMTPSDIYQMQQNIERFKKACSDLSQRKMSVTYDFIEIDEAVKSISYSEEHGYYIDPVDVKSILDKYIVNKEYDHIFVAVRLGSSAKNIEIPIHDWIGLRRNGLLWNWIFKYKITK